MQYYLTQTEQELIDQALGNLDGLCFNLAEKPFELWQEASALYDALSEFKLKHIPAKAVY